MNKKVQIVDFFFFFPAKVFENELLNNNIDFERNHMTFTEGGEYVVYYVDDVDAEVALNLKEKINREDAELQIKYTHPMRKVIAIVGLALVIVYIIHEIIKIINY